MTYEFEGKTEKEAIENAANQLGLQRDQFDVEILESQKNSLFKKGYVKICVHTVDDVQPKDYDDFASATKKSSAENTNALANSDFEKKLLEFIQILIEKMGYEVKVSVAFREERKIGIKLDSPDSSILIGRKGKNLDAIQVLANIYASRLGSEDVRVILDIENYRIRREESIVRLAYTTADKVHQSHKSILLEPMNPFERRLIHTTLNDIPDIETKSEGEGLYKQVRVIYKGVWGN